MIEDYKVYKIVIYIVENDTINKEDNLEPYYTLIYEEEFNRRFEE